MSQDPDDKFLRVLAGQQAADDLDTRRAARLRSYLQRHPSLVEEPRDDPQGEAQLLAYLHARRAAMPHEQTSVDSASATASAGWLQRLVQWLSPPGGGAGLRQAGLALGVLGVGVAVLIAMQPEPDDSASMKRVPSVTELIPIAVEPAVMRAIDPAATAAEIKALLMTSSVSSTILVQTDGTIILYATVPQDALENVANNLRSRGISMSPDGALRLRISRFD